MTLKADLEELSKLSTKLQGLADQAPNLNTALSGVAGIDDGFGEQGFPTSLMEASHFCEDLLSNELIPAIRERLQSTSFVMASTVAQYKGQEDKNVDQLISTYKAAIGDWSVDGAAAK